MSVKFRAIGAAAFVIPAVFATAALAASTRESGSGTCSTYGPSGTLTGTYIGCKIVSQEDDNLSIFVAGEFDASFTGNAMEDLTISQGSSVLARVEDETAWCYLKADASYKICFQPQMH